MLVFILLAILPLCQAAIKPIRPDNFRSYQVGVDSSAYDLYSGQPLVSVIMPVYNRD